MQKIAPSMSIKAMICSCCFDDKILANHNNVNHRAYVYGKHKAFQVEMGTVVRNRDQNFFLNGTEI